MSEQRERPRHGPSRRELLLGAAASLIPKRADAQDPDPREPVAVTDFIGDYGTLREREQAVANAWDRIKAIAEGQPVFYLPRDQQKHSDFLDKQLWGSTDRRPIVRKTVASRRKNRETRVDHNGRFPIGLSHRVVVHLREIRADLQFFSLYIHRNGERKARLKLEWQRSSTPRQSYGDPNDVRGISLEGHARGTNVAMVKLRDDSEKDIAFGYVMGPAPTQERVELAGSIWRKIMEIIATGG